MIVPAINLDRKYTGDEAVNEKKWAFRTDVTATTIWQNKANARDVIRVGPDEPFNEVGLHGYVSTFVAGNARYFVYIVNPGTYTVAGNTYRDDRQRNVAARHPAEAGAFAAGADRLAAQEEHRLHPVAGMVQRAVS